MNDSDAIAACVGKLEDSTEVRQLLDDLGHKKKLRMPKDDIDLRVDLLKLGLTLVFEPEDRKSSRLVLTGAQFYSEAEEDYETFKGSLPGGIVFGETQAEVIARLGKPWFSKKQFRYDAWRQPNGHLLTAEYTKADMTVSMVSVELPQKD